MGEQRVRVGAAASAAGVRIQTLHYYERRGLLRPPGRSLSGYREYGAAEVRRVVGIKRAQALGFTLGEIAELISIADGGRSAREVGELAARKLAEIDAKLRDLERMREALRAAVESCHCGGDIGACCVVDGLAAAEGRSAR